jgi:putative addiction module killer protein
MEMPDIRSYCREDGVCPFTTAFGRIADAKAAARIDTAVRKLERGLRPDIRSVGEGVQEARIDYGPGYRVYFGMDGLDVVVLLLCGDKRTQSEDITFSVVLWKEYRARKQARKREGREPSLLLRPGKGQ